MKKFILLLFLVTIQANSQTNFTGAYAAGNWTLSNTNANGSVDTSAAPNSISLTGGNNWSGNAGETNLSIVTPASGGISFDWTYSTPDGAIYDYPNIILVTVNGVKTIFAGYNSGGGQNQSGSMTVNVIAGELFTFNISTTDNQFGAATIAISNFNYSSVSFPASRIRANQCGTTLALLKSNIKAVILPGAQRHRFLVSDGTNTRLFENNGPNFSLTKMPGTLYGTTYSVRVVFWPLK